MINFVARTKTKITAGEWKYYNKTWHLADSKHRFPKSSFHDYCYYSLEAD